MSDKSIQTQKDFSILTEEILDAIKELGEAGGLTSAIELIRRRLAQQASAPDESIGLDDWMRPLEKARASDAPDAVLNILTAIERNGLLDTLRSLIESEQAIDALGFKLFQLEQDRVNLHHEQKRQERQEFPEAP
jgi:hypothetical protein